MYYLSKVYSEFYLITNKEAYTDDNIVMDKVCNPHHPCGVRAQICIMLVMQPQACNGAQIL